MGEPLYRVSTGNYEYRLVLRCRQEARARFAKMRKDVLEKIELLDQKHGLSSLSCFLLANYCFPEKRDGDTDSTFLSLRSPGHRVPAAALRLGHVPLLRRLLRRPEGGGRVPHRSGPVPHHDQLQQPVAVLHGRRRGGRGRRRGRGREHAGREQHREAD